MKGKVVGVYESTAKEDLKLTESGKKYDAKLSGKLSNLIVQSGPPVKAGKARLLFGLENDTAVAIVCLGKQGVDFNEVEQIHEGREQIRVAVSAGVNALRSAELDIDHIDIDSCGDQEASVEGAQLMAWCYQELKCDKFCQKNVTLDLLEESKSELWNRGFTSAHSQNIARWLMETPANLMTPLLFAEQVKKLVNQNVSVEAHDRKWAESKSMGSFLSVANGSEQPPVFLELTYNGATDKNQKPLALVGKGVTFDSGGFSLKPCEKMGEMRADMGGGACVVGIIHAAASLKIPLNIKGLIPLTENLISGKATKPSDVVRAANGKTIQVDNTDAEGRLILADALCYADSFNPRLVIDIATLTGAMMVALGSSATGVFTKSTPLWELLHQASIRTGDRVWRMPLWNHFTKQVENTHLADLNNVGTKDRIGGACVAAAFLQEFTTAPIWAHLDIAGVMENQDEVPYLCKGMTGRPVRTLVQLLTSLADSKLGLE